MPSISVIRVLIAIRPIPLKPPLRARYRLCPQ